jgi:hypothetical protein
MEEQGVISRIIGYAASFIFSSGKTVVGIELLEKLKVSLARDAAAKAVLNGPYNGKPVVKSLLTSGAWLPHTLRQQKSET